MGGIIGIDSATGAPERGRAIRTSRTVMLVVMRGSIVLLKRGMTGASSRLLESARNCFDFLLASLEGEKKARDPLASKMKPEKEKKRKEKQQHGNGHTDLII